MILIAYKVYKILSRVYLYIVYFRYAYKIKKKSIKRRKKCKFCVGLSNIGQIKYYKYAAKKFKYYFTANNETYAQVKKKKKLFRIKGLLWYQKKRNQIKKEDYLYFQNSFRFPAFLNVVKVFKKLPKQDFSTKKIKLKKNLL